jgi:trimethylamine-N-oxide reductase (cytochrome c)
LHAQLCGAKLRDACTVNGAEPCPINAKDAADRGAKDGDLVRVFDDRGQIIAGVTATDSIRPGVIRINGGDGYDPAEAGKAGRLSRYGDVNVLSVDVPTSELGQGDCGHSIVGEVEKYTGRAVTVGVFTASKGAE